VLPALVFAALTAFGLDSDCRTVAVMQSTMPSVFYGLTLAMVFGLRSSLAANAIAVSKTLLSLATLPLWRLALKCPG
jgi:predicted permease